MYALLCFDRPDSATLRDQHRAAHLEFLQKNSQKIVFGGPLKNTPEGASTGAFYKSGVYESVAVRAFKKVFPQG